MRYLTPKIPFFSISVRDGLETVQNYNFNAATYISAWVAIADEFNLCNLAFKLIQKNIGHRNNIQFADGNVLFRPSLWAWLELNSAEIQILLKMEKL